MPGLENLLPTLPDLLDSAFVNNSHAKPCERERDDGAA
jgi:hypothetical protein